MSKNMKEQLIEQRMGKCRHFNGVMSKVCEAGIRYDDVKKLREDGKVSLPCLLHVDSKNCQKLNCMSFAEAEAKAQEWEDRLSWVAIARAAIVAVLGPYKNGISESKSGSMPCPICNTGTLRYSRAGINGHIHAACTSGKCVSWME